MKIWKKEIGHCGECPERELKGCYGGDPDGKMYAWKWVCTKEKKDIGPFYMKGHKRYGTVAIPDWCPLGEE